MWLRDTWDETYTISDKLYDILFCIIFVIGTAIAIAIFGIPLLVIHLLEYRKRKKFLRFDS